jgi:hypothetical protein
VAAVSRLGTRKLQDGGDDVGGGCRPLRCWGNACCCRNVGDCAGSAACARAPDDPLLFLDAPEPMSVSASMFDVVPSASKGWWLPGLGVKLCDARGELQGVDLTSTSQRRFFFVSAPSARSVKNPLVQLFLCNMNRGLAAPPRYMEQRTDRKNNRNPSSFQPYLPRCWRAKRSGDTNDPPHHDAQQLV